MYHKIHETDEAIKDIRHISYMAYDYTKDKNSGLLFLKLYNLTVSNMDIFPKGFNTLDIEYRNYLIHILPFGNYNLFYVVNEKKEEIYILRILYQKQNWKRILKIENSYHIQGKNISNE